VPSLVVVEPPRFDSPPRIGQVLEPVRIQALIPKASVEAFYVTVLHWFAGLDVDQRYTLARFALCAPLVREENTAGSLY
jgi:hypothetical protein